MTTPKLAIKSFLHSAWESKFDLEIIAIAGQVELHIPIELIR